MGIYPSFLMRHQSTKPVSPAPGDFLPCAHHPQEVDQRGVYDGLRVQIEANKKLIRDVIISRAGRCRPCQDLNYFAGFLIELIFVLNLFFMEIRVVYYEMVMSTEQEVKSQSRKKNLNILGKMRLIY